ncbi:uncharacterized protein BCR38DRAFT_106276 [Pseudomassariella vexata]|uniref:Methyltransferase domain-containing protein n=1 Tax=Pseudomassariella vexata TaxID=1141098 RepID=A0A1Y2EG80_9PEZI|nr:uncharacterized protein BCR38DRAFT_106276 [Pseudomassariella vexata]ORY70427.1 hypothetical protein BCR38DRAFT_106276 [Pseudomassariella vexata]
MLAPVQNQSAPWIATEPDGKEEAINKDAKDGATRHVQWYQPAIKFLPRSTVDFFENYVGVKGKDAITTHIYNVRDMAWQVLPYPCIGLFRFLDFGIHLSPDYPTVVRRVQEGATFLDLGCCFGQDVRKLAYDAGTSFNLIGTDLEEPFLQLGYELFRDRGRCDATFVRGNVFEEDFLEPYRGKINIIYVGSFLHLFNEAQQKKVVRQVNRLLRPQKGSMVFGRHLGAEKGGHFTMKSIGWDLYRHDLQTIADLFQSNGSADGDVQEVKWEVTSSLGRYESANWDDDRRGWQGDETKQMIFTAVRL